MASNASQKQKGSSCSAAPLLTNSEKAQMQAVTVKMHEEVAGFLQNRERKFDIRKRHAEKYGKAKAKAVAA